MNTKDHKLFRFRVRYETMQRINSAVMPIKVDKDYMVLAPSREHADLVVKDDHRTHEGDNLRIDFQAEIKVDAILNRET